MVTCKYFAYGSNMSQGRLLKRVPSASTLGVYSLACHALQFHKFGRDGSAKCDAQYTSKEQDLVWGVLYNIAPGEKKYLDEAEGLGNGYETKIVDLKDRDGQCEVGFLYYATKINDALHPFSWYVQHVLAGALDAGLPDNYIEQIAAIQTIEDMDHKRDLLERSIYRN
jgi:hypothetical protein